LRGRLRQFSDSAGFNRGRDGRPRGRCAGHYAAWGYRKEDYGEEKALNEGVPSDDVYIALVPVPEDAEWVKQMSGAAGVLPAMYESILLWTYFRRNGSLPPLNNSGSHGERRPTFEDGIRQTSEALCEEDILCLLAADRASEPRMKSAAQLVSTIAEVWGYKAAKTHREVEGGDHSVSRTFGLGRWLCVGWDESAPYIGLWRRGEEKALWCSRDEGKVSSESEFRDAVQTVLRNCG
jgi:hypothetical protein